jgi:hypothetical protein
VAVTVRRTVLDEYAPDVSLLTYGSQELNDVLAEAGVEAHLLDQGRFMMGHQAIRTLGELDKALAQAELD